MHLSKVKTDKSDAKMICAYDQNVELKLWSGQSKVQQECLQIIRLLTLYFKQSTALKNKIFGEKTLGNPSKLVLNSLKKNLKNVQSEIKKLEKSLHESVKLEQQELLTLLESVLGMGRKTSIMLIVLTDGFERFQSAKQLCFFFRINAHNQTVTK